MFDQQPSRMHTVPQSYLEAFSTQEPMRRTAAIWRFDRSSAEPKRVGVRDAEVVRDIYTVYAEDGSPDTGIEDKIFVDIEGAFCTARQNLRSHRSVTADDWRSLTVFVSAQLLRTPRMLQGMRELMERIGATYAQDDPPGIMLELIRRGAHRIARMRGTIGFNETGLPLLTCDNPAVTWKPLDNRFQTGVSQSDPAMAISFPIAPDMIFTAAQTSESLTVAGAHFDGDAPSSFSCHVDIGSVPAWEVKRQNLICVVNAHRYVYANYNGNRLSRFLHNNFIGRPGPRPRQDLIALDTPLSDLLER
jgi:hypothetical protein